MVLDEATIMETIIETTTRIKDVESKICLRWSVLIVTRRAIWQKIFQPKAIHRPQMGEIRTLQIHKVHQHGSFKVPSLENQKLKLLKEWNLSGAPNAKWVKTENQCGNLEIRLMSHLNAIPKKIMQLILQLLLLPILLPIPALGIYK